MIDSYSTCVHIHIRDSNDRCYVLHQTTTGRHYTKCMNQVVRCSNKSQLRSFFFIQQPLTRIIEEQNTQKKGKEGNDDDGDDFFLYKIIDYVYRLSLSMAEAQTTYCEMQMDRFTIVLISVLVWLLTCLSFIQKRGQ